MAAPIGPPTAPLDTFPELYGGDDLLVVRGDVASVTFDPNERIILERVYHENRTRLNFVQVRQLIRHEKYDLINTRLKRLWEKNLGKLGA